MTSTYQTGDVLHDGLPHNSAWHVDSIAEDECFCGVLQAPADKQSCSAHAITHSTVSTPSQHTHTHTFNGPFSGTTRVSRYQKGNTNLDFTEARDGEWQWHQLGHMQVCISLQTDNHASTPPLRFLQAGCPSCHPTNSVKALKAFTTHTVTTHHDCTCSR